MAVTTQLSAEYTIQTTTPIVNSNTTDKHGKYRTLFFSHDQDGAGDANSTVTLGKLPAGKVKIIGGLSRFYCNWVTGSQTMDLGWKAYTDLNGDAVALDVDGLVDGLDVDAVGYFDMEGNTAAGKLKGGTYTFESRDGVEITALAIAALVDGDDLCGYITYVID
jgi:hypothetical protein